MAKKKTEWKPKKKVYRGVFLRELKTHKDKYAVGDKYSTEHKKVYEYLINSKIIK